MASVEVLGFPFRTLPEKLGAKQGYKKKDALEKSWFEKVINI